SLHLQIKLLVARSVLVDMEPKVISQAVAKASKSGKWRYGEKAHFCQKQGSGNNWANGYCVHGPRHKESVEDLVRREVERCDRLAGIFAMMSVAGGTGSGVGTFVTQCLRDMYPQAFILNHLTWPYGTGEVIVQNYNSVLTLSRLYQLSDALVVHENDTVHKICSRLMNIKHISIGDINKVIAHQLGSVLQPAYTGDSPSNYSRNPIGITVLPLCMCAISSYFIKNSGKKRIRERLKMMSFFDFTNFWNLWNIIKRKMDDHKPSNQTELLEFLHQE
uniref:Tubulin delta chain n=1 Tax=Astyanax mexicanus TaxID=7994 RepID=A0A8B9GZN7_ASTMX